MGGEGLSASSAGEPKQIARAYQRGSFPKINRCRTITGADLESPMKLRCMPLKCWAEKEELGQFNPGSFKYSTRINVESSNYSIQLYLYCA